MHLGSKASSRLAVPLVVSWVTATNRTTLSVPTSQPLLPPPETQQCTCCCVDAAACYCSLVVVCVYPTEVWLALEEKGIPYDCVLIELYNKPTWYKDLVPTSLVPAVVRRDT